MDARIATVEALLHGSSVFLIPHFQRAYSWQHKHWERLWADLLSISSDQTQRKHFIGPLVCAATTPLAGNNLTRFEVIDGQQRLTTLSILFGAIRDVAFEIGEADLAAQISEDFLLHHRRKDSMRYKLVPRATDRPVWQRLVERYPDSESDGSGIDEAWAWFREQCRALALHEGTPALERLRHAAGQRLAFVSITITDENPYRVFESLNTTGLALTEFDLVRNHLFMKIPIDEQENFDAQVWRPFESLWNQACDSTSEAGKRATVFLRQFLMRKTGRFNKGEAFLQFKTWADGLTVGPTEIVGILTKQAKVAIEMIRAERLRDQRQGGADNADWPSDARHQRLLQLAYCDASTAMPLVLELHDRVDRGEISQSELLGCLQDLVSFLVRRARAGSSTRGYDKKFAEIARSLGTPTRASLQDALHRTGWPRDAAVLAAVRTFPLYLSERLKARLILEELERAFGHKEKVQLAPLQIEHVLPQKLTGNDAREWREMLGERPRSEHERLVHTLGNLTLTGFNQKLSNKAFGEKRRLLKESKLNLNADFSGLRRWNAESIESRGQRLGSAFLDSFPVVGEPPPASEDELQEKLQKVDRNRDFWRQVADIIAERDGDGLAGNPSGKPFLDLPTPFRCLKIVPYFNRRQQVIGVMASFLGKEGDLRFATVRAGREAIEQRFGSKLVERGRGKGNAASLGHERPWTTLENPAGEREATHWLAEQSMRLRDALIPAMEAANARRAKLRNTPKHLTQKRWFQQLLDLARERTPLHAHQTAGVESWVSTGSGFRGLTYMYVVTKSASRVELYFWNSRRDPKRPKRLFDWFLARRRDIDRQLPNLAWERLDDKEACRLSISVARGYSAPDSEWPSIHTALIDAMICLHATMQPYIDSGELERV